MQRSIPRSDLFTPLFFALCGLLLLPSSVRADETSENGDDSPIHLEYRIWGTTGDDGDVTRPEVPGRASHSLLHQRLRVFGAKGVGHFRGVAEFDFAAGTLAGRRALQVPEAAATGTSAAGNAFTTPENLLDPRKAYVQYQSDDVGQLKLGLQTSHWGLGILANDGATEDDRLFNHHYGGDRVFRVIFATAPFAKTYSQFGRNFLVGLGGDYVYRDENASLRRGDSAGQGVLALLYRGSSTQVGHYVTYRSQRDGDGDELRAFVLDYYLEHLWDTRGSWNFRAGAEAAALFGRTNRTLSQVTNEPVDVRGFGAAGEFEAHYRPANVRLRLRTGYASGDRSDDDETISRFRFDPNYQVGLLMFDHYIPAVSAASYEKIHDPSRSAEAPKGASGFVNDGSVENALYLNPRLLFGRKDGLLTGVGFLFARAAQPVYDPFETFANGGTPTGVFGKMPAGRDLGWEVDVAARYRYTPVEPLTLEFKTEYGILFPGSAFETADGSSPSPENLLRASLAAIW